MLWSKLAFTHRKEFAQWISGAKQEETRERRAAKAVAMILEKKQSRNADHVDVHVTHADQVCYQK